MSLITIAEGVEFNTIAREWRMKWSSDDDKKSLVEIQKVVDQYLPTIKAIDGVKDVQRIVCGGCLDYKLIISLSADKFSPWVILYLFIFRIIIIIISYVIIYINDVCRYNNHHVIYINRVRKDIHQKLSF